MAYMEIKGDQLSNIWYLDSECNNHLSGNEMFIKLDKTFRENVKLGNDSNLRVKVKGDAKVEVNYVVHNISWVFFVPKLKYNLISLG